MEIKSCLRPMRASFEAGLPLALEALTALKVLGRLVVGVPLITAVLAVVLVVHSLGVLLALMFGFLAINGVHTLGLGKLVDLGTDEAHEKLLGKGVLHRLAC